MNTLVDEEDHTDERMKEKEENEEAAAVKLDTCKLSVIFTSHLLTFILIPVIVDAKHFTLR